MGTGKVLAAAAAVMLLSGGVAVAKDRLIGLENLDAVGEAGLAQIHGRGVSVSILGESNQTLSQQLTDNTITAGGSINNGAISLDPGAIDHFSGVGNFLLNSGNQNNLGQSTSLVIILH